MMVACMTQPCVACCRGSYDMPCFNIIGLLTANESRTIICTNGIWFNVPLYRILIGMSDHPFTHLPPSTCTCSFTITCVCVSMSECMCVCMAYPSSCVVDCDPPACQPASTCIRYRVLASSTKHSHTSGVLSNQYNFIVGISF